MSIQTGCYVQALYNFPGEETSDLPLSPGDVVRVTQVLDSNWAAGQKVGSQTATGEFPLTFVENLAIPFVQANEKVFLVLQDSSAQENDGLDLRKGDLIKGLEPVDTAWWRGESGTQRGVFPLTVVTELHVDRKSGIKLNEISTANSNILISRPSSTLSAPDAEIQDLKREQSSLSFHSGIEAFSPRCFENCEETHLESNTSAKHFIGQNVRNVSATASSTTKEVDGKDIPNEGLVLHNFIYKGNVAVYKGDIVKMVKLLDQDWLEVQTKDGQSAQIPRNHVSMRNSSLSVPTGDVIEISVRASEDIIECSENEKSLRTSSTLSKSDDNLTEQYSSSSNKSDNCMTAATVNASNSSESIYKPGLPPKSKPPVFPKPTVVSKPTVAPKPATVISTKSFMITKPGLLSKTKSPSQITLSLPGDKISLTSSKGEVSQAKTLLEPLLPMSHDICSESNVYIQSVPNTGTSSRSIIQPEATNQIFTSTKELKINECMSGLSTEASYNHKTSPRSHSVSSEHNSSNDRNSSSAFSVSSSQSGNDISAETSETFSAIEWKISRTRNLSESHVMTKDKAFQLRLSEITPRSHHPPTRIAPQRPNSAKAIITSSEPAQRKSSDNSQLPHREPQAIPLLSRVSLESPADHSPKRPHQKAADCLDQSSGRSTFYITAQIPQAPQRQPPKPTSIPASPRRPPPRPTDHKLPDKPRCEDVYAELVADIKKKREENLAEIKKYEQSRSGLQRSLLQADAMEEKEELKSSLQFTERQLDGLKEEKCRLEESLFAINPQEAKLEKARLLAAQQAEEDDKRKEEERKKVLELKEKKMNQRTKVIQEILDTEKDYLFSLKLCLVTFLDGQKPPPGVDIDFILGNMEEIADVSHKLLTNLEICVSGKSSSEQCLGRCFTFYAEDMKNTYAPYCRNHDEVITAMERYAESAEISEYLSQRLEKMKQQMNVFDLSGVLIKPVQRILKYPLLLNELLKNTEDGHSDKEDIVTAIMEMTEVAKAINEYKRRKDLVYKYKKDTDQTFGDKLSKLNLHSIKKKSSRIRGRISTNFGIALQLKDEVFDKEEAKFQQLEKAVKAFLASVQQYIFQSQETMNCQVVVVDGMRNFYGEKQCAEMSKLHGVTDRLTGLFGNMKETVENVVLAPLSNLAGMFNGPIKVIEKRYDKLLDYNYQLGKTENDKELLAAKNDYEAMNAQLLDELPKFYNLAFKMLRHCISVFVLARRDFMDQSLKEICALLELPSIASTANMIQTFKIRHTTAFDQMSQLSFIPRGFNTRVDAVKADRIKQRGHLHADGSAQRQVNPSSSSQNDTQRRYLHQLYAANKLYMVTSTHNAVDLMDVSLSEGTLVGVVKELDPMGNKERWFVDDGESKGFIPCNILTPLDCTPPGSVNNADEEDDIISILSADSDDNLVLTGGDGRVEYNTSGSSTDSSSHHHPQQQQQQQRQYQFYYALYDFHSRHANEASLTAGHPVTVLAYQDRDGNSEWWLVESETEHGYAPANYLAAVPYS